MKLAPLIALLLLSSLPACASDETAATIEPTTTEPTH
jgi:hypothetical protein